MNKQGEIIIVDDDKEDADMTCEALHSLHISNKCVFMPSAQDALEYIRKPESDPFFIICDYRMPRITGLEFRQMIQADAELVKKAIPFVMFSTAIDSSSFNIALSLGVQGFYVKPTKFEELQELLKTIYTYFIEAVGN